MTPFASVFRGPRAASRRPLALLVVLVGLLAAACSPHRELYPRLEELAQGRQYEQAAKLVEESKDLYGERNAVLWNLDRGVMYHYAGDYEASNKAFEEAERRIDELFTESITGNIAAFGINDNTLPYRGEDFESVVINIYRALNYAKLGDVEAALVEARKVNQKLLYINDQYPEGEKNVYAQDPFARMLMGVFYELGGTRDDVNDAYISDKLAAEGYAQAFVPQYGVNAPEPLRVNLLTTAAFMGPEELGQARERYPGVELLPLDEKRTQAQLYVVHFAGRAPRKVEDSIGAVMPDGNLIKIAFPRYKRVPYTIAGSRLRVGGDLATTLQVAEPVGDIAITSLESRRGRITAKAIARATTKYMANRALQERARKESDAAGVLAFLAGNVYTAVSEQADLRAWQTLPDRMLLGRVLLPPGTHALSVDFLDRAGGTVRTRDLGELTLQAGETRFILLHTVY